MNLEYLQFRLLRELFPLLLSMETKITIIYCETDHFWSHRPALIQINDPSFFYDHLWLWAEDSVWTEPLYLWRLTKANLEHELDIKAMKVNISPNCMLLKAQPGVCRRSRGKPVKASAPIWDKVKQELTAERRNKEHGGTPRQTHRCLQI